MNTVCLQALVQILRLLCSVNYTLSFWHSLWFLLYLWFPSFVPADVIKMARQYCCWERLFLVVVYLLISAENGFKDKKKT